MHTPKWSGHIAAVAAICFLTIAPPVFADPVTFTIVPGQTFPDGGSITGTFTFDFGSGLFGSFDFLTGPFTAHSDAGDVVLPSIEYSSSFPYFLISNVPITGLTLVDLTTLPALGFNFFKTTLFATLSNGGALLNISEEAFEYAPCCYQTIRDVTVVLESSGAPVPEPSTWLLFGSGLAGLAAWRRRHQG
jgi:hypothetical protein